MSTRYKKAGSKIKREKTKKNEKIEKIEKIKIKNMIKIDQQKRKNL